MATTSSTGTGIQVGGLVSGIDTGAIIDSLTSIEQTRVTREQNQKALVEDTQTAFTDLASRVSSLSSVATTLSKAASFALFTATTNDAELATVTGSETGSAGAFDVVVQQLATTEKVASSNFATTNTSLNLTGTFEVSRSAAAIASDPTKKTTTIDIKPTDALKDIVNKINAAEGSAVKASILNSGTGQNRLVLTGVEQGSDAFFLKETAGTALSAGLALIDPVQSARTEFNFVKATGGAADSTTLFKDLFTSIGGNKLQTGDKISISGQSADGTVATTDFTIDATTSTVGDLLTQIRSVYGANTNVSLNQSGEISLTNTGSGTGAISMTLAYTGLNPTSTMSLGETKAQNQFTSEINEGSRSFYLLDGMAVSSQTNADAKTVVGSTINLIKADPTKTVKLALAVDKTSIKSKIQDLIDQYNSVLSFIAEQSKVVVKNTKSTATDTGVQSKGPLANDSTVRQLKQQLTTLMTSPVELLKGKTQYNSLSRIGITTDRTTGLLTVDDTTLNKALDTDIDGVKSLFMASGFSSNPAHEMGRFDDKTTKSGVYDVDPDANTISKTSLASDMATALRSDNILMSKEGDSKGLSITAPIGSGTGKFTFVRGIASQLKMFVDNAKDSSKGLFTKAQQSFQSRLSDFDDRIATLTTHVETVRQRLTTQYAALEQSMQKLKTQSSAFTSQISSL